MSISGIHLVFFFFFQAEDGIRDLTVTGVQTCALPICVVDLDLGARPFAEQHPVTDLEVDRDELSVFVAATWTDGDHLSLSRLLFGGIRNDDSACGLILGVDARNHHAVVKRPKLHICSPKLLFLLIFMTIEQRVCYGRKMKAAPFLFNWCAFSTRQARLLIRC